MPILLYTQKFKKELRSLTTKNPKLAGQIDKSLKQFCMDPRHHSLRTHKLKGKLHTAWSISVNRSQRIAFSRNGQNIVLLCFGTHDDVYR
jgi:addiction module RelE/StbE family toxin